MYHIRVLTSMSNTEAAIHPSIRDMQVNNQSVTPGKPVTSSDEELKIRVLASINLIATDYKKNLNSVIQTIKTLKYHNKIYFRFAKSDLVRPEDVLKAITLIYGAASFSDQTDGCIQRFDKSRDLLSDCYYYRLESTYYSDLITDPKIIEEKNKLIQELNNHISAVKYRMQTK